MCDGEYLSYDIQEIIVLNKTGEFVKGYGYASVSRK